MPLHTDRKVQPVKTTADWSPGVATTAVSAMFSNKQSRTSRLKIVSLSVAFPPRKLELSTIPAPLKSSGPWNSQLLKRWPERLVP